MFKRIDPTYPPLNTLKAVSDDVWIVDGPIIRFGMPWPKMTFPTRMTAIRVGGGDLFLHSPTALVPSLRAEIERIGTPRWIIGPNRIHYWWIPDWRTAFPDAGVYLAPRIAEQASGRINFSHLMLDGDNGYPWDAAIATVAVTGSFMTEFDFFHRTSRTLVLTDLIENFEQNKIGFFMRWVVRLGGSLHPDGQMPRDMRLTFAKYKSDLKAAVETMLAWEPERIILAHGRWYDANGADELRRAFRWLLD